MSITSTIKKYKKIAFAPGNPVSISRALVYISIIISVETGIWTVIKLL